MLNKKTNKDSLAFHSSPLFISKPLFSSSRAMQNQGENNRQSTLVFADLEVEGRRVECPRCHVPFTPHLGNLIAPFQCGSCRANLSYINNSERTVRCPCCNFSRPMPELRTLVCGGCGARVVCKNGDRAVKCSRCKYITTPPVANYGVRPVNRAVPPQVNRAVVSPQVNRDVSPDQIDQVVARQVNRVIAFQVNQVPPPPQVNQVVAPEVNRVVASNVSRVDLPQINRVPPPQVNRRSESTATSSSFTPKPESSHTTLAESIADSVAESVAQIVRDAVLAIVRVKREAEEDNTEAKNKKIRLD